MPREPLHYSVTEVAAKLGISRQQVGNLIRDGKLAATKVGKSYIVTPADLAKLPRDRPTGRPPKQK